MLHSSTKKLIDRLAEMTELGKLDWTEGDDGNIIYSTEGYSVHLPASADEVLITSISGKELERAASADLAVSHNEDGTSYADIVAEMTKEATRIALGTETAISTLLAGMEEPAAPEPEPEVAVEEPEDVVNETTALAEEETVAPEVEPAEEVVAEAVEAEADAEPEVEAESESETVEEGASEELVANNEEELAPAFAASEAEEVSVSEDEDSAEPVAAFAIIDDEDSESEETSTEASDATDTVAHDIAPAESESELTEAVARLADEVNGRDESEIGAAAASAVGAVALAAGLTEDGEETTEPEIDEAPEAPTEIEATEPDPAESIAAPIATASSVAYVPFGTEAVEEEPSPVTVEAETEVAAPEETVAIEPEAEEADADPGEPDAEPETAEIVTPSFVSVAASLEKEESEETPSFETFSAETASEPAPMETVAATPETAESADPVEDIAPEVALTSEPEPEEPPQSYSLSGIGAGFGLGALAAKTEASGIPGPSDPAPEQEKIIIDATDDVLPEPEGQSSFSTVPSSGNGISFGNTEKPESAAETEGEAEEDTDILKPRTRFNPWD